LSTPRLVVTLHPEVTDREAVLPTCASAAIVWGTPHPAPLPWRGEGNKEVSRRSVDLPGEGHPGEEQRKRGEEGRTQDMDPDQEPHAGESPAQAGYTLPDPFDIPPEPRPYSLRLPSQLSKEDYVAKTPDEAAHSPLLPGGGDAGEKADEAFFSNQVNRVIGEISHRLLDTLARGEALPEAAAVAPALQTVVESPEAALRLAGEVLSEIRACQADPFLGPLLSPNLPVARSEWLVEAWHTGNDLYRGQIDRLVYDGRDWWLLDYKTSRPAAGISWEAFMTSELEKYLVQLLAYREMAARFYQVDPPELIKTALYFTACRRHILL
jgi:ATP-dependent helicase/nuclease subunit A